jgi:hydroxyacylglutathione hydrolase
MLLRRFYDDKLAQASYLVGCQRTGEALVVDPARDVEPYLAAARAEGLRVTHVTETHIHADYVSGSRELASRARAQLYLSGEGGRDWSYGFAATDGAKLLKDGDVVKVGNITLAVMHTPGHTPEHVAFVVTDAANTARPMGVFSGDCVFVGDVGRPDLLEKAAGLAGTMEASARVLFRSLQRFKQLPDYLQVWPAHGAGSACGKALGAVPSSTVGYERFANWGLTTEDEDAFVAMVLAGQPEPPRYFAHMKRINRDGPRVLGGLPRLPRLPATELAALLAAGAVVVDTRRTADFAQGHAPGSLNVPLSPSFPTYAGSVLPYDRPLTLLVDGRGEAAVEELVRALASIGLDEVTGWLGPDALEAFQASGRALGTVPQATPQDLAPRLAAGEVVVVDVRNRSEWDAGHLRGALHLPLARIADRLEQVPRGVPLVMQCETGSRSAVAASLLLAHGFTGVANLKGGINAWVQAGQTLEKDTPASQPAGVS